MAGSLFLHENKNCAVYRAVHFELVTSASTDLFLMPFRRFVACRGRCSTAYCDNDSNFIRTANYLKQLDWNRIHKHSTAISFDWKFNPPTAAWSETLICRLKEYQNKLAITMKK